MFFYWVLFTYFAIGAAREQVAARGAPMPFLLNAGLVLMTVMIGLRLEVGGDWHQYLEMFRLSAFDDLSSSLAHGDTGYTLLNFFAMRAGGGMWTVNLIGAAIFTAGLYLLARRQPLPWLTILLAVPYLVIVVAMGYTRQAAAIGILMAGIASLEKRENLVQFAAYVAVAALFHKTAVLVLPIVIFSTRRNVVLTAIGGVGLSYALYSLFLDKSVDNLMRNYVGTSYGSQGTAIRLTMDMVAAIVMLSFGRRLRFAEAERKVWMAFSFTALVALAVFFVSPSSTAVDRLALYLIPMQLVILPRLVWITRNEQFARVTLILYAFAIQFTWLNYAVNASYWVPYRSYLTNDPTR